ncbi:hypothetical protein ACQQ2N_03130 [Dokdonella sp. MW10]|uniref:hypothetical protein n=1 Tax=Dokdonella sp. MW10 TaxID=2992926 RepID=UPI003F81AB3D
MAPDEQRRIDAEDLALQVEYAESLASEAEAVFIGQVTSIDDASLAHVVVDRVLKGKAETSVRLPAHGLEGLVISCRESDMFHNGQVSAGLRYIFYLRDGNVLRAGWVERRSGNLSLRDEARIVRRVEGD